MKLYTAMIENGYSPETTILFLDVNIYWVPIKYTETNSIRLVKIY